MQQAYAQVAPSACRGQPSEPLHTCRCNLPSQALPPTETFLLVGFCLELIHAVCTWLHKDALPHPAQSCPYAMQESEGSDEDICTQFHSSGCRKVEGN